MKITKADKALSLRIQLLNRLCNEWGLKRTYDSKTEYYHLHDEKVTQPFYIGRGELTNRPECEIIALVSGWQELIHPHKQSPSVYLDGVEQPIPKFVVAHTGMIAVEAVNMVSPDYTPIDLPQEMKEFWANKSVELMQSAIKEKKKKPKLKKKPDSLYEALHSKYGDA